MFELFYTHPMQEILGLVRMGLDLVRSVLAVVMALAMPIARAAIDGMFWSLWFSASDCAVGYPVRELRFLELHFAGAILTVG